MGHNGRVVTSYQKGPGAGTHQGFLGITENPKKEPTFEPLEKSGMVEN